MANDAPGTALQFARATAAATSDASVSVRGRAVGRGNAEGVRRPGEMRRGEQEDLFDRLLARFQEFFDASREKTAADFDDALDRACDTLVAAGEFTAENAERLRQFLRRDLLQRDHPDMTFRTGDITTAGTVTCEGCGWTIQTTRTTLLPSAPSAGRRRTARPLIGFGKAHEGAFAETMACHCRVGARGLLVRAVALAQAYPAKPVSHHRAVRRRRSGRHLRARRRRRACRKRSGSRSWSRTVPAAARSIGTDAVAKSAPDGYTLLMMSNTHTVNESLIANKPFQLMRDFVPVAPVNYSDLVLVVHPSVPANKLARVHRARQVEAGRAQLRLVGHRARRTTWPASSSRRWRAWTSCTFRTRAARARAPTSSAARCR